MIEVELSSDEIWQSLVVAASRKIASDRRRSSDKASRRDEHYSETRTWDQEIESAAAELAVARWRNRYWWGACFRRKTAGSDAGSAQVRWTQHDTGHLILYEEDAASNVYVFVVGRTPTMKIVGWIYGHEARQQRYWRSTGVKCPSWWVPQSDLRQVRP